MPLDGLSPYKLILCDGKHMKRRPEKSDPLRRHVYMLICWQEQKDPGKVTWLFSLEVPGKSQRRLFGSLDNVMATIQTELDWE